MKTDFHVTDSSSIIKKFLSNKTVTQIARETGYLERLRKCTPFKMLWTLVNGLSTPRTETIADLQRAFIIMEKDTIAYKAFYERLSQPFLPSFLKSTFEYLLQNCCGKVMKSSSPYLKMFKDIIIHDGTSFALHDELEPYFPGRFTQMSPAAVEVHCTYSLFNAQCNAVSIAPDKDPERIFLPDSSSLNRKLLLMDRGYLWLKRFREIEEHGGYFITRLNDIVNPVILHSFGTRLNGVRYGKTKFKDIKLPKRTVDLWIRSKGADRKPYEMRLVCLYIKKKKKHVCFLTNLIPDQMPPEVVAETYRLRWQIELFFKELKSYTNLRKFRTQNPVIAEALIWGTMIAFLIRRFVVLRCFHKKRKAKLSSPLVAAKNAWQYIGKIAHCAFNGYRGLTQILKEIFWFLDCIAIRTNPNRQDSFSRLALVPCGFKA